MIIADRIFKEIEVLFPLELAMPFDNSGFFLGDKRKAVKRLLLSLDPSLHAINFAIEHQIDLIICHHPFTLSTFKKIDLSTYLGSKLLLLMNNDISFYSCHTNFDVSENGMNILLAKMLGLKQIHKLSETEFIGRVGFLEECTKLSEFSKFVAKVLKCKTLRYVGSSDSLVRSVAVCGGSGGSFINNLFNVVDVYVTGDIKHHDAMDSLDGGLNLIDAGHYETEDLFCKFMHKFLSGKFIDLEIFVFPSACPFNYLSID